MTQDTVNITVEFSGGLELLFNNERSHKLSLPRTSPTGQPTTVGDLVTYLVSHTMKDKRTELFVVDNAVRPGILVLINEADWELEGEDAYILQERDNILFVSTLHGG